jgi:hypothetical protein
MQARDTSRLMESIRAHFQAGRVLPYGTSNAVADIFVDAKCNEGLELLVSTINKDPSWVALRSGLMHFLDQNKANEAWMAFGRLRDIVMREKRFPGMALFAKMAHLFSNTNNQAWVC